MKRAIVLAALALAVGSSSGCPGCNGGGHTWLVGTSGALATTSDGVHFTGYRAPTTADLFALKCIGREGWAVGAGGVLLRTTDAGSSWSLLDTGVRVTLRGLAFADSSLGLAVGDGGTLLRTLDSGTSWSPVPSGATGALRDAAFLPGGAVAWVVGDGGTALRSIDGGASFAPVAGFPPVDFQAVRFASAGGGRGAMVGAGGTVLLTLDGRSWAAADTAPADLAGLAISADGQRLVAVGAGGLVWRSGDGGATWAAVDGGTAADLAAIGFDDTDPGEGWAVGAGGTILHTLDGARTFTALPAPAAVDYTAAEDL